MKLLITSAAALLLVQTSAFPFVMEASNPLMKFDATKRSASPIEKRVPFDAKEQYRSNKGKHKFIAPKPGDHRGPCPGLNAMANHGYIPRNGEGTIAEFTHACTYLYGMSQSLALFLSTFGAIMDGDLLAWNVGGKPHTGISGAHANYESDASIIRGDLHQYGNSDSVQMSQFNALYNLQPNAKTANYDMSVMKTYRHTRFLQSINENPVFFYEPFSGIEVTQAGFSFTYRFFGNKSAEYPEGRLDKNVLKSFYSIYGPENKLYWKPGYEKIPDNWYTRNSNDQYGAQSLQEDILYMATETPGIVTVGCNVAGKGTYDVIDPGAMTGGAYDSDAVAESPLCFSTAYVLARAQSDLLMDAATLATLTSAVEGIMDSLGGCQEIQTLKLTQLQGCPGFSQYGGPHGKVAPGAIQN